MNRVDSECANDSLVINKPAHTPQKMRDIILRVVLARRISRDHLINDMYRTMLEILAREYLGAYSPLLYDMSLYLITGDIEHIEFHCWFQHRINKITDFVPLERINKYTCRASGFTWAMDDYIRTGNAIDLMSSSRMTLERHKEIYAPAVARRLRIARHPLVVERLNKLLDIINGS